MVSVTFVGLPLVGSQIVSYRSIYIRRLSSFFGGIKIFEFNIFGGFRKMDIFLLI